MIDIITQFISNIWLAWDIFWQMGAVESIYEQFVIFSKDYHSTGTLPSSEVLSQFSTKVHGLKVVQEYCGTIDVVEMIKAYVPFDALQNYCSIPEELDEQMMKSLVVNPNP